MAFERADDIVRCGYLPAMRTKRAPWQDPVFVPAEFLAISRCLVRDLPRPEFWDWYINRTDADRAHAQCPSSEGLLAVGLVGDDARVFLEEHGAPWGRPPSVTGRTSSPTPFDLVAARASMPADSEPLGFDVVGVEYGVSMMHSWMCHSYEARAWEELGLRLDAGGLFESYESAARVLEWMEARPPEEAPEPVAWTVVVIASCRPSTVRGAADARPMTP